VLHEQFPAGRQVKTQEVEDATRDPGRICRELLVEHRERLDAGRGEPFLPGRVVLTYHLNPLMDLIKVKLSTMTGLCPRGLDGIVPHASLLGPEQRHRLGHGVVPSQVDKTDTAERARQQADAVT